MVSSITLKLNSTKWKKHIFKSHKGIFKILLIYTSRKRKEKRSNVTIDYDWQKLFATNIAFIGTTKLRFELLHNFILFCFISNDNTKNVNRFFSEIILQKVYNHTFLETKDKLKTMYFLKLFCFSWD